MKHIWITALFLLSYQAAAFDQRDLPYVPELQSAAWSPDLTKDEIREIRFAIYRLAMSNNDPALEVLPKYITDKRNIEIRYAYASALAWIDIDESIEMLKQLSIEGYPYALETYREERVCQLEQYNLLCEQHGFIEVMRRAFLNWVEKDKLIPDMYERVTWYMPEMGYADKDQFYFTPEAETTLIKGMEQGSYRAAYKLYLALARNPDKTPDEQKQMEYYYNAAKKLMIEGNSSRSYSAPSSSCYGDIEQAKKRHNICLNQRETQQVLDNLAKKGMTSNYSATFRAMHEHIPEVYSVLINQDIYQYVRFVVNEGDTNFAEQYPREIREQFERAVELNNGRGWGYHGSHGSIEDWEKLYEDTETKSFFEKAYDLLGGDDS